MRTVFKTFGLKSNESRCRNGIKRGALLPVLLVIDCLLSHTDLHISLLYPPNSSSQLPIGYFRINDTDIKTLHHYASILGGTRSSSLRIYNISRNKKNGVQQKLSLYLPYCKEMVKFFLVLRILILN